MRHFVACVKLTYPLALFKTFVTFLKQFATPYKQLYPIHYTLAANAYNPSNKKTLTHCLYY